MSQMRLSFTDADGETHDKTLSDEELLTLINALAAWTVGADLPALTPQEIETSKSLWVGILMTDAYREAQNRYWRSQGSSYTEEPDAGEDRP